MERVSFTDYEGVEHAMMVEADSLYHAVGMAIARFRKSELPREPGPNDKFTVEPRETTVQQTVTHEQFKKWLNRPGVDSPSQTIQRGQLQELLREAKEPPEKRKRQPYH